MSNDIQPTGILDVDAITPRSFGMRLKSTREARGLAYQDVAAQLRLTERMVQMIENEIYPQGIPITFIRGYIRAYAKYLEIPEKEIKKALEIFQTENAINKEIFLKKPPITSQNYSMKLITYFIVIMLISLVGIWWYSHNKEPQLNPIAEHILKLRNENETASNRAVEPTIYSQNAQLGSTADTATTDKVSATPKHSHLASHRESALIIGNHHLMQFVIHLLLFVLIGLSAYWWYHYKMIKRLAGGDTEFNTAPEQFNLAQQATHFTNILEDRQLADFEFTVDKEYTINRIRLFSALIICSIALLFSIWWISYLLLFTPAYLNPSNENKDSFTFSAKEPFMDVQSSSIPITINNTEAEEVHAKTNERINANDMKQIAPTSIEKYTPNPITSSINTSTNSKIRSD